MFLVELDVRIKEEGKSFKERNDFKENISLLAAAAGYRLDTNQSTRVMLEQFCVGTDKTTIYPDDPRSESVRPIRDVEYKFALLKSNEITSEKWRDKKDNDMDNCNPVLPSISESKLPIPKFNGILKFDNEMVQV